MSTTVKTTPHTQAAAAAVAAKRQSSFESGDSGDLSSKSRFGAQHTHCSTALKTTSLWFPTWFTKGGSSCSFEEKVSLRVEEVGRRRAFSSSLHKAHRQQQHSGQKFYTTTYYILQSSEGTSTRGGHPVLPPSTFANFGERRNFDRS